MTQAPKQAAARQAMSAWAASVFLAAALLTLAGSPAHATPDQLEQNHGSIRKAARDLLTKLTADQAISPEIEIGALDPRLHLTACDRLLEAFLPTGTSPEGRTAVGVRCTGAKPWSLYLSSNVRTFAKVLVTTQSLRRGAQLQASDLAFEVRETSNLTASAVSDLERTVGMLLKRPLAAGAVITGSALEAPRLVRRGQTVTIIAEVAGLVVRSAGKALADGASGDLIRVRNPFSKQVIQGLVTSPGVVRVQM